MVLKTIAGIILLAIMTVIINIGFQSMLSSGNVIGLKGAVGNTQDIAKVYLSESPIVGTYANVSLSNLGFASSSVPIADDAVYNYNEQVVVDSDGQITEKDKSGSVKTYTSVSFITDSDASGNVDNSDSATALDATTTITMLDGSKPGLFMTIEEGDGTNGGEAGDAVISFGVAEGSVFSASEKAKFEAAYTSIGNLKVINGTNTTDGIFTLVVSPY